VKFDLYHIILIGIVVISGGALLWPVLTQRSKKASPAEATLLINRGKTTIVDVRTAEEFGTGRLPESVNIPAADLANRLGELEKSKSKTVIVVCQKGTRAFSAAKVLEKAGFTDVVVLEGGVAAWQAASLPMKK